MRADLFLYENGFSKSRTHAQNLIKNRFVLYNGQVVEKVSAQLEDKSLVTVLEDMPFVSRGGLKLQCAIDTFGVEVKDKIVLDAGASTGGFTDCLLKNGAFTVYAVDCGFGQLSDKLRSDKRVINIEGVNVRYLTKDIIKSPCSLCVSDLSFISQTLCYDSISSVTAEECDYISLFKPQFEVGRENVGKNGIVHNRDAIFNSALHIISEAEKRGFKFGGIISSPILGGDGNMEFLIHYIKSNGKIQPNENEIKEMVKEKVYIL